MVTILNKDSNVALWDKYSVLFRKANAKLNLTGDDEIKNLETYFANMGTLAATGEAIYRLLPLDETPFIINANTRTIVIPQEFSKCGAVKGDNFCEVATFVIDRYFDFKDLADTTIVVQWINADKEQGITRIAPQFIDLESEPHKIRFGWPLLNNITKTPGIVQFAIRFIVEDEAGTLHYVLNTIPAALTVKDTLNIINPDFVNERDDDAFMSFIANSIHPDSTVPAQPTFGASVGGIDLPPLGAMRGSTLELKAQAVANDNGTITYAWYYTPEDSEISAKIENSATQYDIVNQYVEAKLVTDMHGNILRGLDKYWINTGSEEAASYERYTGEWPPANGVTLYEEITTLTIHGIQDTGITGKYHVEAMNSFSGREEEDKRLSPTHKSAECLVPGPRDIVITKDLDNEHQFIGTQLEVAIQQDKNNPEISYSWYKSQNNKDFDLVAGAIAAKYSPNESGWYYAEVSADLNNSNKEKNSKVCRITDQPAVGEVKCYYQISNGDKKYLTEDSEEISSLWNDVITLGVEHDIDVNNKLYSDKLTYIWQVQIPDSGKYVPLSEHMELLDKENSDLNNATIKVVGVRGEDSLKGYAYRCVVENELGGKIASKASAEFLVI